MWEFKIKGHYFLTVAFLVFIWSLASFSVASAAVVAPTAARVTATSTDSISIAWTNGVADTSANFTVEQSLDNSTYTLVSSTIATSTTSYVASSLNLNTRYWFRISATAAGNLSTSSAATTSPAYTLATATDAPTIGTPTVSSLPITIVDTNNPSANTTYAIYNYTDNSFLGYSDGAATTTAAAFYQATSTWGASFSATGLTANTAYQFVVLARNGDASSTASSTASTAVYTYTNAPSSLTATVDSASQITISWSGDSTAYYATNDTAGTNSGWTSATSWVSSGLGACGKTYSFSVKGRNASSVETALASVSATTNTCSTGGFSAPTPPAAAVNTTVSASLGAVSGNNITLKLSAPEAVQMAISEKADFSDGSWMVYSASPTFKVSDGAGLKTIYVKFRYANSSESSVYNVSVQIAQAGSSNNQVVKPVTANVPAAQGGVSKAKINLPAALDVSSLKPGQTIKYSYSWVNTAAKSKSIKIVRDLLKDGKIVTRATGSYTIKAGKTFNFNVKQTFNKKLKTGKYTVIVRIYDRSKGTNIDNASFDLNLQ